MHYVGERGGASLGYQIDDPPLSDYIESEIIPRVPEDMWLETDGLFPFQRSTNIWTIVNEAFPHCTGEKKTDCVYVLECRQNSRHQHAALLDLEKDKRRWQKEVNGADRLIYVGLAKNLLRRLDQHLDESNRGGADFTHVFPPIRVLDVSWYSSYQRARRAEKLVAKYLSERFPNDCVWQPG